MRQNPTYGGFLESPPKPYASSLYSTSSQHASSALDTLHSTRKMALDRLKGWRKSSQAPPKAPALGDAAGPQISLQPLQCKPNAREPLQQRDISDPRSLAYHANKYSVSDDASIIRRQRPDRVRQNEKPSADTFSDSLSYRPRTGSSSKRLSVLSSYSLTPTPAPPSATAQSIPDSPRPRQSTLCEFEPEMSTMHRTNTSSSARSRTSYVPANPVSVWDDDDDEPKKSLFNRFKTSRSFSARKTSASSTISEVSSRAPSVKAPSVKSSKSLKPTKSAKTPKTKTKRGNIHNKFGIDDLGDYEWNVHGYMEGSDEDDSDKEIEAALKRVREAEAREKETTPTPASHSASSVPSRTTTSHSTPTPETVPSKPSKSSKVSPVLPPISPSQSLDLGLDAPSERFENEVLNLKPSASPNYARDHVANLLRRKANQSVPQTPVQTEQCPWDTWKYTSNHHTYQITPPDSTRSSHVYAADSVYDTSHHSMVLPESPVQLQPVSTSSSSSSDRSKWDDISANLALIQQKIQDMPLHERELARDYAAKELTKPATLVTPTTISPATFPAPLSSFPTPPRPSRDNVELPDCFSKPFLTMTSSPSVRPLPRRINKLGPALEESDASPDSSQRSSVSTRLSTAPSSPEPDMRCFV
ncbi:hypothetical protein CJU89_1231 [Yarrowia sp. B02]|nr:hypothetical protein CJU89_1231 [Yarrowia sp. B02]